MAVPGANEKPHSTAQQRATHLPNRLRSSLASLAVVRNGEAVS